MIKSLLTLCACIGIVQPISTVTAASVTDAAVVRNRHMGVTCHLSRDPAHLDQAVQALSDLGVGWVRDGVDWPNIEKERGQYAIPANELRWIDALHAKGINIVLLVNHYGGLPKKLGYSDPYDPDAYARMAAFLAKELKGKIQAIEVLNEPSNFGFRKAYGGTWNGMEADGSVSPWVSRYVTLLNKAAKAIKAANPDIKVIGLGSAAPVNFRQIKMGIVPEVDGIVDHPYSPRSVPEILPFAAGMIKRDGVATADERGTFASQIRMYREISSQYKGPKELWFTEMGFPCHVEKEPGMFQGYTREAQAIYALRRFSECLGLGIELSCWYDLHDDGGNVYDAECNFGLLDYHWKPKPVYSALQNLARFMLPYEPTDDLKAEVFINNSRPDQWPITWDGTKLETNGAIMKYAFKAKDGSLMLLVWSSERPSDLQPRIADIEVTGQNLSASVFRKNLLTGQETVVAAKPDSNGRLMLETMWVPAYPVAYVFRPNP